MRIFIIGFFVVLLLFILGGSMYKKEKRMEQIRFDACVEQGYGEKICRLYSVSPKEVKLK
jgi:hypothetical protein